MDKEDMVCICVYICMCIHMNIHNGIYSATKHGNLANYNNMDGTRGYVLNEMTHRKTDTISSSYI